MIETGSGFAVSISPVKSEEGVLLLRFAFPRMVALVQSNLVRARVHPAYSPSHCTNSPPAEPSHISVLV